ncbi:MAG: helix-turn-helix transcriptional regulator [Propionibacteriaceae bacterium]
MTTAVRVQVLGLDLRNLETQAALAEFENATFGKIDGLGFMTVYVEDHEAVVETVIEAARKLVNKVPGTSVVRVDPDLVSASEIAVRVGVSREAVRKWVHGTRIPFPCQFGTIGKDQRVWRWVEVVQWLEAAKSIDMNERHPSAANIAHIDSCLAKVPDATDHEWSTVSAPSRVEELLKVAFQGGEATVVSWAYHQRTSNLGSLIGVG